MPVFQRNLIPRQVSNNLSAINNAGTGIGTAARAGIVAGASVGAGVAVPVAATATLGAAGFTTAGVAAGSVAAGIQSGIGAVAAGSWFAAAQSAGALGGFAILGPVGFGAAAVVGVSIGVGFAIHAIVKAVKENRSRHPAQGLNLHV